jgi:hypothetical protein
VSASVIIIPFLSPSESFILSPILSIKPSIPIYNKRD